MNRNSNVTYIFKMDDDSIEFEKGRNSFGAYCNARDRVEQRTGRTIAEDVTDTYDWAIAQPTR